MKLIILVAFSLSFCGDAWKVHAEVWRSELYPKDWMPPKESQSFGTDKFLQDFSYAGFRSGEEPIPERKENILNVVTDYGADPAGEIDSTYAIQDAIDDAGKLPQGGVVYLPPGEYQVSTGNRHALRITSDNVILRGAGSDQTHIINHTTNMRGKSMIVLESPHRPAEMLDDNPVGLSRDILGPTHIIHLDEASRFEAGDWVELRWDFTYDWIVEHGQTKWWGVPGDPDPGNPERAPRPAAYPRKVTEVNPDDGWIRVHAPIRYTAKIRDNARVYKLGNRITGCGIENLGLGNVEIKVDSPASADDGWGETDHKDPATPAGMAHQSTLIKVAFARDCWIRDVHSVQYKRNSTKTHFLSNGFRILHSFNLSLLNCTLQSPQYGGGSQNGYLIQLMDSSENLIAGCRTMHGRHGLVVTGPGTSGNVFFECEDAYTARAVGNGSGPEGYYRTKGEGSDTHNFFTHSNLWDSCLVVESRFEAFHRKHYGGSLNPGSTSAHGVFWNIRGNGDGFDTIVISDQARYGYIIGTSGANSAVSTKVNFESNHEPEDHSEGIGRGNQLEPQSLWLDQRRRRLGQEKVHIAYTPLEKQKSAGE